MALAVKEAKKMNSAYIQSTVEQIISYATLLITVPILGKLARILAVYVRCTE